MSNDAYLNNMAQFLIQIELKYIEDVQRRRVCFSKRRSGLMKKAQELAVLCNAEIGVIVFSATGKLYEFASSSIQQIIRRYITSTGAWPDDASRLLAQRAEEVRNLKRDVARLESENRSLKEALERAVSDNQRIIYNNSNMETELTLRPPSWNVALLK
ncbi:putative transcription factor MADS-type1 family [Helianthus annuus]|uniref:Putative transcription factor, MADS-box n=2 Tax=Helianthus annuus TaxID=4232 RepID=A0A251VN10_HELAN|nr:MADS-box transcription factor 25 isoform X1 [Helianthus annuus]XP_021971164.1 MADS-box transcription factor 25 isoform X1 [Helianthus annuus]XP_021971167.1 MADS-box transcription factor 25 isoform X1 [Helianthus annuus]KAF5822330.1 putative transcription factor MADS-type1 family [Helianthus annuus]KAJ0611824.1 putative transcription factor MADS-type1 family [Helianthus annuus]KAJ0627181.1 putative transcription factor MADS-type1 family [Helianthus annuus]KAJ0809964.1 putative transcription